jgi:TnpA family transposase
MERYTDKDVIKRFEKAVKDRMTARVFNAMPRTYRDVFLLSEVREDMARYIVKLLNCDENVNNRIQYLADDIDKQRKT